jgi:putative FmdB family regulatory protein
MMPIYTFQCEYCGHQFEELIFKAADEDELVCPECGATRPRRRMSVTARVSGKSGGGTSCGFPPTPSCSPGGG